MTVSELKKKLDEYYDEVIADTKKQIVNEEASEETLEIICRFFGSVETFMEHY